jgi:hypothetical protein
MKQLFKCNDTMIIENRTLMTLKIIFNWHSLQSLKGSSCGDRVCLFICLYVCNLVRATKPLDFHEIQYRSSYRKLLSKSEFPKNCLTDHLPLLSVVNKFLPPLSTMQESFE